MRAKFHVEKEIICKHCSKSFIAVTTKKVYCCDDCKYKHLDFLKSEKRKATEIENIDYVVCKWCNLALTRIHGGHLHRYHPEKNNTDYKDEFGPSALTRTPTDKKASTSHFGDHMKTDKWRKIQSDRMIGEKNIMSKTKTTEEKRKSNSPFSIEFYIKRNPDLNEAECKELKLIAFKEYTKDRLNWNQKECWIKRGFTESEAIAIIAKKQARGLSFLSEKYGEKEGYERWIARTTLWKSKVFNATTHIGRGTSVVSEHLFLKIIELIDDIPVLYGKSEKFIRDKNTGLVYKYDFTLPEIKKIIEFNGDYWHCNPVKYDKDYYHSVKKKTAAEIWAYDKAKRELAEKYEYKVLTIWEKEFTKNPELVLEKCIKFIYDD